MLRRLIVTSPAYIRAMRTCMQRGYATFAGEVSFKNKK